MKKKHWILIIFALIIFGIIFCILFNYCTSFGCSYCGIYVRSGFYYMIECNNRLRSICYPCHSSNWTVKIEPDETIEMCFEEYWVDKAPKYYEYCSDIKQFCESVIMSTTTTYTTTIMNYSIEEETFCNEDDDCFIASYTYECCGAPCGVIMNRQAFERRRLWTLSHCTEEDYELCPSVNCEDVVPITVCENNRCKIVEWI